MVGADAKKSGAPAPREVGIDPNGSEDPNGSALAAGFALHHAAFYRQWFGHRRSTKTLVDRSALP